MKTLKTIATLFSMLLFGLFITSCEDEPTVVNEEELITTLTLTLTPPTGGPVVFQFQDLDGDGGDTAIITSGTLAANTTYTGSLALLNESETPAEVITTEIQEEDEDHQFFYEVSSALNLTAAYADQDSLGNPIGLATTVTTGAASTGTLKITLRHEPNKSATDVAAGDITNAGGETDIEVTFDVKVQ